jgi:hypothetical protein
MCVASIKIFLLILGSICAVELNHIYFAAWNMKQSIGYMIMWNKVLHVNRQR